MTTTSTQCGLNDAQRPTSRVLAPPGGGSSNIFGAQDEQPKPRAASANSGSNIFGADKEVSPAQQTPPTQKRDDSKNRLFGPPSPPTPVSTKNRDVSYNKLFGEPDPIQAKPNQYKKDSPQPVAVATTASQKRAFNPITGLPYGDSPEVQVGNDDKVKGDNDTSTRNSSRVTNPPGGRSSGPLW